MNIMDKQRFAEQILGLLGEGPSEVELRILRHHDPDVANVQVMSGVRVCTLSIGNFSKLKGRKELLYSTLQAALANVAGDEGGAQPTPQRVGP